MRHWLVEEWAINPGDMHLIDCSRVYSYIDFMGYNPTSIPIEDISYKKINDDASARLRIELADINQPGILVEDMINPHDKKYRLIDGKHRIYKNTQLGFKFFKAFLLSKEEVLNFIEDGSHYYKTHS